MKDLRIVPPDVLLALCVWAESRGEPVEGQIAVAWVVRRRVERRRSTYVDQILKPYQFSAFNETDPNRAKIDDLATRTDAQRDNEQGWRQALYVARGVIGNWLADNVRGADHYATTAILLSSEAPSWADPAKQVVVIGHHTFFRLEG